MTQVFTIRVSLPYMITPKIVSRFLLELEWHLCRFGLCFRESDVTALNQVGLYNNQFVQYTVVVQGPKVWQRHAFEEYADKLKKDGYNVIIWRTCEVLRDGGDSRYPLHS